MTRAQVLPGTEEVVSSLTNGSEPPTTLDLKNGSAAIIEIDEHVPLAPDLEVLQAHLPAGLLVVDETGLILWRNLSASEILGAACGIEERQGRIRIERASLDRTLQESLQAQAAGKQDKPLAVGVPDRDGRMHYVLRLFSMLAKENPPSIVIAIVDLVNGSGVNRLAAAKVFNLSKREAEFAELFSEGLNIEEIAPRMGVAPNTARIHLRNIFAKTGCSNQTELARILARTATIVY